MRSTKSPSWTRRLLGIDPQVASPHVFAVDERRLRYARFVREEGGVRRADHGQLELAPGTFASGPLGGLLSEPARFPSEIRALLDDSGSETEGEKGADPDRASLVVPDRWLRVVFAEVSDLPAAAAARDEVLRWKLRRLVPFRVEELRVRGVEVTPLARPSEPRRVMLGFAVEMLLAQLEAAFAEVGIRIGHISNTVLSLADAVVPAGEERATLLVSALRQGYSLLFVVAGEPRLYRYKGLDGDLDRAVAAPLVKRELLLTRSFLAEQLPGSPLERVIVAGREEHEAEWVGYLESTLECTAEVLSSSHLRLLGDPPPSSTAGAPRHTAPLLGAALREVA